MPAQYRQVARLRSARLQLNELTAVSPSDRRIPAYPDPTVPPPADFRVQTADQRNHCFAQIIKKSGSLCLTLDIRVA
jgi:hypothetical protein